MLGVASKQIANTIDNLDVPSWSYCEFAANDIFCKYKTIFCWKSLTYLITLIQIVVYCDFDYAKSYLLQEKLNSNIETEINEEPRLVKVARPNPFDSESIVFI